MKKYKTPIIITAIALTIAAIFTFTKKDAQFYINEANNALNAPRTTQQAFEANTIYAIKNLDIAKSKYPLRLDIRFGKAYICSLIEDTQCLQDEIIKTLELSQTNNNQWQWENNETKDNTFMLDAIQPYQEMLLRNHKDKESFAISKTVLKYYPQDIKTLNNLATYYFYQGNFAKAKEVLLEANKINPDDEIIIKNLQLINKQ